MQQEKKLEILKKHYREYYKDSFSGERLIEIVDLALCIKEETKAIMNAMEEYATEQHPAVGAVSDPEALTVADYEKVLEVHSGFVRDLDIIINGSNAAKQASLCDIVAQLEKEWPKKQKGAVWVKATERLPIVLDETLESIPSSKSFHINFTDASGWEIKSTGVFFKDDNVVYCNISYGPDMLIMDRNFDRLKWLDESNEQPEQKESDAVEFLDWSYENFKGYDAVQEKWVYGDDEKRYTTIELYNEYKKQNK